MSSQVIQQLTIHLKGGQTINIQFNAEKAETLNPQIDAFLQYVGHKDKQENNFLFQGARVLLVRISEVAAAEVVSMIRKDEAPAQAPAK
jgi:hypothetical protein